MKRLILFWVGAVALLALASGCASTDATQAIDTTLRILDRLEEEHLIPRDSRLEAAKIVAEELSAAQKEAEDASEVGAQPEGGGAEIEAEGETP